MKTTTAKKRDPLASCAAKLGRKGGQATARKRKAKPAKAPAPAPTAPRRPTVFEEVAACRAAALVRNETRRAALATRRAHRRPAA